MLITPENAPRDINGWPILPTSYVKVSRPNSLSPKTLSIFKGTVEYMTNEGDVLVWIRERKTGSLKPARPETIEVKRRTKKRSR